MKNKKLKVKKIYRIFDSVFFTKRDAKVIQEGWEHKEKIYTLWAIVEHPAKETKLDGINYGIPVSEVDLFVSKEAAIEELKDITEE
ncbi:hypothetical protein [Bacillus alkalicellulosilyticus]|uniref:hypothetical protein n=1 Tax=Alkalihalobacterium alkalicellulosilyticum TaxID=1912214 RepID=UPI000998B896|nr:hypothetical protein [Bacillus alkalicellulosilyticus]